MTEIIIQLKRNNQWIVTVQGKAKEYICEQFSTRVKFENNTTARLEFNTYLLNRFTYWLKYQEFEYEYKEIF